MSAYGSLERTEISNSWSLEMFGAVDQNVRKHNLCERSYRVLSELLHVTLGPPKMLFCTASFAVTFIT